jgi:hypothetical protein
LPLISSAVGSKEFAPNPSSSSEPSSRIVGKGTALDFGTDDDRAADIRNDLLVGTLRVSGVPLSNDAESGGLSARFVTLFATSSPNRLAIKCCCLDLIEGWIVAMSIIDTVAKIVSKE